MPYKIFLYGPPGAGKDTQAEALSRALNIPWLTAGGLLRDEVAKKTALGDYAAPFMSRGEVAPGAASVVMRERVLSPALQASGYILNGYPRTLAALQDFLRDDTPTHVVHLVVSDEVARSRLAGRGRADDHGAAIANRLLHYRQHGIATCQAIRDGASIPYYEIDGTQDIVTVTNNILAAVRAR